MTPFEQFWREYPRKRNKALAQKIWAKNNFDSELENILFGVKYFLKTDWKDREEKFIPHASTFLNQQRWLDILDSETKQASQAEMLKSKGWRFVPGSGWIPPAASVC